MRQNVLCVRWDLMCETECMRAEGEETADHRAYNTT